MAFRLSSAPARRLQKFRPRRYLLPCNLLSSTFSNSIVVGRVHLSRSKDLACSLFLSSFRGVSSLDGPSSSQKNSGVHETEENKDDNNNDDRENNDDDREESNWYLRYLESHPLLTKALSTLVVVACGDLVAQFVIEKKSLAKYDVARTVRMGFLGLVMIGPALHYWYGALYRIFPEVSTKGALARMALDQGFFAPVFLVSFLSSMFALEGRQDELWHHLKNHYWSSLLVNWELWIPAQFVVFKFVPMKFQVLVVNLVAVAWNSYLSWSGHVHENEADAQAGHSKTN